VYSEKFNLERRPDLDQILYEQSTRFVFQRNMTEPHLDETDVFISINSGLAAGVEMFWTTQGTPFTSQFFQVQCCVLTFCDAPSPMFDASNC
jgi:hypothetical protein